MTAPKRLIVYQYRHDTETIRDFLAVYRATLSREEGTTATTRSLSILERLLHEELMDRWEPLLEEPIDRQLLQQLADSPPVANQAYQGVRNWVREHPHERVHGGPINNEDAYEFYNHVYWEHGAPARPDVVAIERYLYEIRLLDDPFVRRKRQPRHPGKRP